MWRLLSNRIPVDTKLQWRKIELASKCHCCPGSPGIESLQHLFVQGAGANRVWREFDGWYKGSRESLSINDTIPDRLEVWARRINQPNKTHFSRIIPYLILWFLWAERNKSRHNGIVFKPFNVVWQVQVHLRKLMTNGSVGSKQWKGITLTMDIPSRMERRIPPPMVMPVKWNPPDVPWIKLNTKGIIRGDSAGAGGGGAVRNHLGCLVKAFAAPFAAQSGLEADLLAIHQGVLLAKELGHPFWIESENAQACALISTRNAGPAHTRQVMARIFNLLRACTFKTVLVPRECNKAASFLAKMGTESTMSQLFDGLSAPRILRGIIRSEQQGIPYLRIVDGEE